MEGCEHHPQGAWPDLCCEDPLVVVCRVAVAQTGAGAREEAAMADGRAWTREVVLGGIHCKGEATRVC